SGSAASGSPDQPGFELALHRKPVLRRYVAISQALAEFRRTGDLGATGDIFLENLPCSSQFVSLDRGGRRAFSFFLNVIDKADRLSEYSLLVILGEEVCNGQVHPIVDGRPQPG